MATITEEKIRALSISVALIEELRIAMTTKDDFKPLLGGTDMKIDEKLGTKQWLERIPIIVTTNEDLSSRLACVDREALQTRIV